MSQFNRFLWTGLVLGLAACGDDVTVTNPPEPPPPPTPGVTAVSVAPDGATINVGGTLGMTAAATLEPGAAAPTWAWSSSSAAATVAANGASATVTAVSAGSVGIRATATSGTSSASGVATVNIVAAAVCSITGVGVTPASADLVVNQTLQFAASVTGTNCVAADLGVTWSVVGSPAGATINASGVFSATAAGNYVVRATSTKDATKTNTAAVSVTVPAPATVSIQSITQFATNVPVDLTNVGGQIEITLNVDPGAAPQVTKAQALINGIVVAEQIIVAPSAAEASPSLAPQTLVLSTNTRQVKTAGGSHVPVIFNGPAQVTARIFVTASTVPAVSNAVPVVMQNADAWVPGTTPALTPASATPTFTNNVPATGTIWYKGNVTFTGGPHYISFFPVTPTITGTSVCGSSSNATLGTPSTGLTLAGTFTCGSSIEGGVAITGWAITPGTAPAADVIYIAAGATEQVGSAFTVDGQSRYNLLSGGTLNNGNTVFIDNKAPTVTLKTIAFNTSFDQLWINGGFAFNAANVIATTNEAGTGVASTQAYAHPVAAIACGTATPVATGADLAETITSTNVDGWRICARQTDNIGNVGALAGFSNYFGVDTGAPTARFVSATLPATVGTISTVSSTANTTIYSMAAPQPAGTIYGIEANDSRSGFHQGGALTNFPVNMSHTYFGVGVSTSCAVASYGLPTVLADAFVRSTEQPEGCVVTPQYNTWSAFVTDRAGNASSSFTRNYAKDDLAVADINNISFAQLLYAPGTSAGFNVFGTDDLEIIEGTLAVHYNGDNAGAPEFIVRYPYSLFPIGTRWDAILTNTVSGLPLTISNLIGRFDTTATATNLPSGGYASRQNALPDSVYANLRDVASQPDAAPMGVALNAITQFSDSTTAPWGSAPAAVFGDPNSIWLGSIVGPNHLATQRTGTSVTVPYFDSVNLYGVVGGELVLCGTYGAPVLSDNGVFRTWQYTMATPTGANACTGAPNWRVGGVKGNAIMLSQQF